MNKRGKKNYVGCCELAAKLTLIMTAIQNTAADVEVVNDVEIKHHFSVAEREVNRMMECLVNRIEELERN